MRKEQRKRLRNPGGTVFDLLTPDTQHAFEVLRAELEPGAVDKGTRPYSHPGEEFILVKRGRLRLYHGHHTYELAEGDSIIFRGNAPHWADNPHAEPCELIIVICPPAY